jgi:hypothetical protein
LVGVNALGIGPRGTVGLQLLPFEFQTGKKEVLILFVQAVLLIHSGFYTGKGTILFPERKISGDGNPVDFGRSSGSYGASP